MMNMSNRIISISQRTSTRELDLTQTTLEEVEELSKCRRLTLSLTMESKVMIVVEAEKPLKSHRSRYWKESFPGNPLEEWLNLLLISKIREADHPLVDQSISPMLRINKTTMSSITIRECSQQWLRQAWTSIISLSNSST
jgi:hypothetical protein